MSDPIEFSQTRLEIGKALLKAQGKIGPLIKDQSNPFFNSKYADLASVVEVVKTPLQDSGLVLIQGASVTESVNVETVLLHAESGEWVRTILALTPTKNDPQGVGSAITYARRYGLQALCGIAPEDDDGNAASRPQEGAGVARGPFPKPFTSDKPVPAGGTPETHGQQKLQTVIEFAQMNEPKDDDKDPRMWYNAGAKGRKFWTRDESVGHQLLAAKGAEVILTLIPGTKNPNSYKVLNVEIPDGLPGLEGE